MESRPFSPYPMAILTEAPHRLGCTELITLSVPACMSEFSRASDYVTTVTLSVSLYHSSGTYSPNSRHRDPGSDLRHGMWDL
jgi:hypothetical protein